MAHKRLWTLSASELLEKVEEVESTHKRLWTLSASELLEKVEEVESKPSPRLEVAFLAACK